MSTEKLHINCPKSRARTGDFGQIWSQTLTVTNFVHMDPFELAPNPKYRGQKALQNGPKTVKNGVSKCVDVLDSCLDKVFWWAILDLNQ